MFSRWIKEHKIISILVILLVVSVALLVVTKTTGGTVKLGPLNRMYMLIEKPMTTLGTQIKENVSGIFSYRKLLEENEALKAENEALRSEMSQQAFSTKELQRLEELSAALNYEFVQSGLNIVTANVISLDVANWTNSFVIDKGTESGIEVDDIVICGRGLVGRITAADTNWSKVVPIIDESSHISFYVEGTGNMLGIIEGTGNGKITGYMLDNTVEISEGDRLITSGIGLYPEGIELGRVTKSWYDSTKQLMMLEVKPEVDFGSIDKVSVII